MPNTNKILANLKLEIDGNPASAAILNKITRVVVEHKNHEPSRFTIRLELDGSAANVFDEANDLVTKDFEVGKEIKIAHGTQQRSVPLIVGEVTSLGVDLSKARPNQKVAVIVRGADISHRLLRKQQARTFLDLKFSDIADRVAQGYHLSIDADVTARKIAYVMQSTQTDWEFLQQIANHIGYDLYVYEKKLYFKKAASRGRHSLTWGQGLVQFQPEANIASLDSTVNVAGWDPTKKKSVVGKAASFVPPVQGATDLKGLAKGVFGEGNISVNQHVIRSQAEADEVASAIAAALGWSSLRATGKLKPGSTKILPGIILKVNGIGDFLSREYRVTSARHVMSLKEGYITHLETGEWQPGVAQETQPAYKPNLVVGIVTDNQDPEDAGRVKVKFPGPPPETESTWARIAAPMAGPDRGIYILPEVDDEVLVAFEHGDVNAPYIVGALWNGVDLPPEKNSDGKNNMRMIRSRSGHVIRFDDTEGEEKIEIVDKSEKANIIIDSTSGKVSVNASEGDISIDAGGDMTLQATDNVTISAGKKLQLKGNQKALVESGTQATVKARVATLEGTAQAKVKGPTGEINK